MTSLGQTYIHKNFFCQVKNPHAIVDDAECIFGYKINKAEGLRPILPNSVWKYLKTEKSNYRKLCK